ncbi:MAG TPA: ABC transporter permease [Cyclobacteriaceae bacterium]|nr:ABC transporter permease [Cyclobacteriaceae bacterium]HMV09897.1 ABC transporter permease [Cyclobacteriaceae bacterium]HMV88723.1 ABC transporter permease [Cyclobacteriaceae bacterium]HMW99635.1 ABC transporter permease [Cyclobacteriaceae bacterium]HMX50988.1 ABC transporter permease [Cyclobacteriaceae bacterium]
MLRNFLLIASRNLLKRKVYSFINIFGLALGMAVCLVILKYVDFELSYDSYHTRADQIHRVNSTYYQNGELRSSNIISGYGLGPALVNDIPGVKTYIRTHPMYGGAVLTYEHENNPIIFHEENIQFADSTFFDVFTYRVIEGDLNTALDKPSSIVITKKIADRYFKGMEDPLGKIFHINGGWADGEYEVTAVIEDIPQNSHFPFEIILPMHNLLTNGQYQQDDGWGWNNFVTYVELEKNADIKAMEEKLPALVEKYQGEDLARSNSTRVYSFQPIREIHLKPGLNHESSATISVNTIYFFLLISGFILAIAWVNYINLSTARAMERAREVGIKKSIGAFRSQLLMQFVFESVLVNLLSVIIAVCIALGLLPLLGEIVGKTLAFDFTNYRLWLVISGLFVVGSFISGLYPAYMLSSFRITEVIKGKTIQSGRGFSLRKALVVFQFASSLILIAGTFAIYRQITFMRNQDKGLTMDQMLILNGPSVLDWKDGRAVRNRLVSLKEELKKIPGVVNVTTSGAIPGGGHNWGTSMRKVGAQFEENKAGSVVWVDPDFVDTYGMNVIAGRNFNIAIKSDMESVLVNEAALTAFNLGTPEQALEEKIILGDDSVAIVGVLKNYNWASLKTEHTPWLLKSDTIARRNYSIHVNSSNVNEVIANVEKTFKDAFPGNPFDYFFLDDFFNAQYKSEQQFGKIFSLFSMLAIVIACLGLWGLASFTTAQKLKEISIRKVLGSSVGGILSLLSWQFLKLVIIASVIAIPLTWYGIDQWLKGFAFRIGLQWDLFLVPVVILAAIALGTVSLQILRGANVNPAKVLRSE